MDRLRLAISLGAISSLVLACVVPAEAIDGQFCPLSGLVLKLQNIKGAYTLTWKGADPSDPALCLSVGEGPGYGAYNGQTLRRIYGHYDIDNYVMRDGDIAKIRSGLQSLLAGQTAQVKFELSMGAKGRPYSWSQTDTWKRDGQDVLTIDGRPVNVIKLQKETVAGPGSNYSAVWEFWYDPTRHSLLQGRVTSGDTRFPDFQTLSASGP